MMPLGAKRGAGWTCLGAALLCGFAAAARAEDVAWSGFLTTGAAFSNRTTPYNSGVTKVPDIGPETYLGLNLSKDLDPTLRVAAQFLAKEAAAEGSVQADWVFVTYQPINSLEITVGKQKLPIWMVSSYIDVGTAYPWAHPPEEVYSLLNLKSFSGLALRYQLDLGPTVLAVKPYTGETEVEVTPNAPTNDSKLRAKHMVGTGVGWTWGKTTLRAAYNRAQWDLNLGSAVELGQRRLEIWSYGLSTGYANFVLMAEYATTKDLDQDKYLKDADEAAVDAVAAAAAGDKTTAAKLGAKSALLKNRIGGAKAYYVTAGYQWTPVSLYLTYASLKRTYQPGVIADQRSTAVDLDFDVTADSVIKLEAKRISLPDGSPGLFHPTAGSSVDALDGAMIYTVNYNLTF